VDGPAGKKKVVSAEGFSEFTQVTLKAPSCLLRQRVAKQLVRKCLIFLYTQHPYTLSTTLLIGLLLGATRQKRLLSSFFVEGVRHKAKAWEDGFAVGLGLFVGWLFLLVDEMILLQDTSSPTGLTDLLMWGPGCFSTPTVHIWPQLTGGFQLLRQSLWP
jgi:hypothetical protein